MDKNYTTITLDTSVFDGNHLRLERGLLARMTQFNNSRTKFVITDICVNELISHLDDKVRTSKVELEKALDEANEHLFYDGSELNEAKKLLVDSESISDLVHRRVERFLKKTGAEIIVTEDFVSLAEVTERYFKAQPPFSSVGKKKNEFPDAISLLALEKWAREKGETIYAVSQDNDWYKYCESSELIDCYKNLADALDHFNRRDIPLHNVKILEQSIVNNRATKFLSQLTRELDSSFSGIFVDQNADSFHYWDPEGAEVTFDDFSFSNDEFKIIEIEDESIVIEAFLNVELNVVGWFNLSQYDSIDRDHVHIGSVEKEVHPNFDVRILITITGKLSEEISSADELEIDSIEVIDKIDSIDFGELSIDYSRDYE